MEIVHPLLGKFQIIDEIGHGSFASVYLARHSVLQYPVAIKIFNEINKEEKVYKSIMHPFICQDFDLIKTPDSKNCLIMEYVEGKTLLEYANLCGTLFEGEIRKIFGQLIIATEYLHKHSIIHRDLKCENIMLDKYKNVRLIDLDFSCQDLSLHSTLCGSPEYVAPEIISNQSYGNSVDIWSLGIILYAITYGKLPFHNDNYSVMFQLITFSEPQYPPDPRVSANLVDLIKKILVKNPENRITIGEMKKHPFFTTDSDGSEFIFSEQQITSLIREPYSKSNPDEQVLKLMKLSKPNTIDAINEIKSGEMTYYSMTYNILYKNFISNDSMQLYSKSFIWPVNIKTKKNTTEKELPLLLGDNKNTKSEIVSSASHFQLNTLTSNNFNTHKIPKQVGLQLKINENVKYRRFSSISKPSLALGTKKSCFNSANIMGFHSQLKIRNFVNNHNHEFNAPLKLLPHLEAHPEQ